jgi:hypothetical protein
MLKTAANPGGTPLAAFDQIRTAVLSDRSQFFKDLSLPFYGYNRPGAKVSEGVRDSFWRQGMLCGMPGSFFCIKAFSETDLTQDLKKIDVPTLILHGDDDQIVIRHTLSPFHTTRKSAPLSGRARCLLSGPLQSGVRLLRDPLPAAYLHTLRRAYPTGPSGWEDNGFTEFHSDDTVGWVLPLNRRCCVSVSRNWSETSNRMPFLAQARKAIFACQS